MDYKMPKSRKCISCGKWQFENWMKSDKGYCILKEKWKEECTRIKK